MIDLHTHSNFSDGSDTPAHLARLAADLGLRAIALTDHDTTESHVEMAKSCAEVGLELVPGVEVSLRDEAMPIVRPDGVEEHRNVHVLAYFLPLDPAHPVQGLLARLRHDRDTRNHRLLESLHGFGFDRLSFDYLVELAELPESIGRPHFARAMFHLHPELVGEENPDNWNRVFAEWLGHGGRAYIPKGDTTIEDFTNALDGTSTVLSIAHPLVNYLEGLGTIESTMPRVMDSLRDRGFRGVECYYGGSSVATRALMVKLTRDAGMIPTGGSDYHGTYKEDVRLGVGRWGDLRVPDEVLDELKAAAG